MNRMEELKIRNMADIWSILYLYLARPLVKDLGIEGELLLREGIRNFGVDRGEALRKKHIKTNLKINLYNLFTYSDLPPDPRFRRNKIKLTPQERLSETLVCPLANIWAKYNGKELGQTYCEEIHHAKFKAYAPKTQVNLSQTITKGDNHCRFSLYLRPANMNLKERQLSFKEPDTGYFLKQKLEFKGQTYREGYEMLSLKIYYHITSLALLKFSTKAETLVINSLNDFALFVYEFLKEKALSLGMVIDENFVGENCPINLKPTETSRNIWGYYTDKEPERIFNQSFLLTLRKLVNS